MKYKVGDKVRIVKKWNNKTNQNKYGEMDKWLGKVMTIRAVLPHGVYRMVEDEGEGMHGWVWNENCIEGLAKEFPKIVITTDGTETMARLYKGGKVVKSATAKCHPQDSFDAYIGARIAFDRLLERHLAEKLKEQKWRVVNRPVRDGDYIRLVIKAFSFNQVGDILKVSEKCNRGAYVKQKDHPERKENCQASPDYAWCYLPEHFVVIEPVGTPEMPEEPKFFTGKAVCLKGDGKYFTVGKIYEFVDGKTMDNFGFERPHGYRVDSNFETLKKDTGGRYDFMPIVE